MRRFLLLYYVVWSINVCKVFGTIHVCDRCSVYTHIGYVFVIDSLKASRLYQEAARVLIDYAEDIEEAVVTLLEGNSWEETLRLVYLFHRTDLVETHLKPSLLEAHQNHLSLFESLQSTFLRHSTRLAVVREQKRLKQNAILGEHENCYPLSYIAS